jgi:hypothetical protein
LAANGAQAVVSYNSSPYFGQGEERCKVVKIRVGGNPAPASVQEQGDENQH